jgi:hypothetical protein
MASGDARSRLLRGSSVGECPPGVARDAVRGICDHYANATIPHKTAPKATGIRGDPAGKAVGECRRLTRSMSGLL